MDTDDDDVVGESAAGETGASAPGDEWHTFIREQPNHSDRFVSRAGKNRELWLSSVTRQAVGVINEQLALPKKDMPTADDLGESLGQRRCRGWSDGRSLRGLGHPFNLAFVFLRWGDHQAQCVPFDAKV